MSERSMWRMCCEYPPTIVTEDSRYQQAGPDELSGALEALGVEPVPLPIWHLDGIDWCAADPPPKRHKHWPQTVGQVKLFEETWRCPCGAFGAPRQPWVFLDKPRVAPSPPWWRRLVGQP